MKKLILTVALGVACVAAYAQGTLNFGNANAQVNARIYLGDVGSTDLPLGTAYIAQLWYGPAGSSESALQPLAQTATFATVAAQAGYFFGGARTIDGVAGGTEIAAQVRVWNAAAGPTWDAARMNPLGETGMSSIIPVTLSTPPATPANLVGLQSFAVVPVPEPSTFALAGLGAAAMLIFRRRK